VQTLSLKSLNFIDVRYALEKNLKLDPMRLNVRVHSAVHRSFVPFKLLENIEY